jgi:hypothetical protein
MKYKNTLKALLYMLAATGFANLIVYLVTEESKAGLWILITGILGFIALDTTLRPLDK